MKIFIGAPVRQSEEVFQRIPEKPHNLENLVKLTGFLFAQFADLASI